MAEFSIIIYLINAFKTFHSWVLKKFGYKIVKFDEYPEVTEEVKNDYPEESEKCIEERHNEAKFYWSKKFIPEYEKYYEIHQNKKTYFKNSSGAYLRIKRKKET